MKDSKLNFDLYVEKLLVNLSEDNIDSSSVANSNLTPEQGKNLVNTFKQSVLLPLKNGKNIADLDQNQVKAAISGGLIDPATSTISDNALSHVNADPDLAGHFLPATDTAQQSATTNTSTQQNTQQKLQQQQPQNSTTSTPTSNTSTNRAGVVSSVYKI